MNDEPNYDSELLVQTEVKRLPAGWSLRLLSDFIERPEYGFTASASSEPIGPKFLRITDIQDGNVTWETVPYCSNHASLDDRKLLRPNDIVVARIGATTGKAFLIDECPTAVFASYLIRIRTSESKLNARFLYYFFQTETYWRHIEKHKDDRLKGGVNIPILNDLQMTIPPLSEQSAIVKILDCASAAYSVELTTITSVQNLKRAAMQRLFTSGLRNEALKETEIGSTPESWEIVPFSQAFSIAEGQVDPRTEPYASMFHVGPENVEQNTGCLLQCDIAKELGLISGKYSFSRGDIVYSKIRPYLRKAVLVDFEGICSADMYPLKVRDDFDANFLFAYLLSDKFTSQVTPHQGRTGIPKINREQLNSVRVPKPSIREQSEIGAIIKAIDQKSEAHRKKRAVLKDLFTALLGKLMTGQIRAADLDPSALAIDAGKSSTDGNKSSPAEAVA